MLCKPNKLSVSSIIHAPPQSRSVHPTPGTFRTLFAWWLVLARELGSAGRACSVPRRAQQRELQLPTVDTLKSPSNLAAREEISTKNWEGLTPQIKNPSTTFSQNRIYIWKPKQLSGISRPHSKSVVNTGGRAGTAASPPEPEI